MLLLLLTAVKIFKLNEFQRERERERERRRQVRVLCDDTLLFEKINGNGAKVCLNSTVFSLFLENQAKI